ncbi:reverse transcriptase zinc-binding domain-containing protein, partial [Tanacetum coccineum]
ITRTGQVTKYSTKAVWKDMCSEGPKVVWRSLIWFSQCVPRHSFVLWMAVQNMLMTQDKIVIWKPNEIMKCTLCNQCPDSHSHLFFACPYSNIVWSEMLKVVNKKITASRNDIVEEMAKMITK